MLNCETSEYKYQDLILDKNTSLVVIVSNLKRQLISSPYNTRVAECKEGLRLIQKEFKVDNLSQLDVKDLPKIREIIKDNISKKPTTINKALLSLVSLSIINTPLLFYMNYSIY